MTDTDNASADRRVAVITGASRGIGAGLAHYFHERGVHLGLCARSACALADGERVLTERFDIRHEAAVDAFAERVAARFGHIDVWINNAGVLAPVGPLRTVAVDEFKHNLDVNVVGVFLASRAYARQVRASARGGVLINISSGAATSPYAGWSAYCAGKAAVDLLSGCIQLEERDAGLRVHAVAPGIIDTDMQDIARTSSVEDFPLVADFRGYKERDAFNRPEYVAEKLFQLAFDPQPEHGQPEHGQVNVALPAQFPERF